MDTIAIIVVHYNSDQDTKECLGSLDDLDTSGLKVRLIVVDNGSQKPFSIPKNLEPQNYELIRSQANLGFTGGNNLGITYAREKYEPDYFLLLNNDTLVDSQALQYLYKLAKSHPDTGLISPKIYFAKGYEFHKSNYRDSQKGKVLWYAGGSIDWPNLSAFHRGVDEIDRRQFDDQRESDFATGCCLLIPRKVIETVGLLDKKYFLYLEDVDLNLRVKKAGLRILFQPQAVIWHKNAGSTGGAGGPTSVYYQSRNRLYFAFKHGGFRVKLTALKLLVQNLFGSSTLKRQSGTDFLMGRMEKQAII